MSFRPATTAVTSPAIQAAAVVCAVIGMTIGGTGTPGSDVGEKTTG